MSAKLKWRLKYGAGYLFREVCGSGQSKEREKLFADIAEAHSLTPGQMNFIAGAFVERGWIVIEKGRRARSSVWVKPTSMGRDAWRKKQANRPRTTRSA